MITNIKTEFRYMNACGVYQKLDGKYFEATWRQDYEDHYTTEYDEEGELKTESVFEIARRKFENDKPS